MGTNVVMCCLCHDPVTPSGWCLNCQSWPINITPRRYDGAAHLVNPDGWCKTCRAYQATELLPEPGIWRDTGRRPQLLSKEENQAHARQVAAILHGAGWPEKQVPLREDYIPRRWKRGRFRKVGETPLGYRIVEPDEENDTTDEVPF